MQLFIDDADLVAIRRLCALYPIDGVTTNPTILARAAGRPDAVLREIRAAIGAERLLFAQAIPADAEGMLRDARAIVRLLGENTVVKVPAVPEGYRAIRLLKAEGIRACGTVVYTPMQAFLAAKAGADYVAPYVNRIDNLGFDGVAVVRQIQDILSAHGLPTRVLAASFKNSRQVQELCAYGIGAATCAPAVIDAFAANAQVNADAAAFARDFARVAGEGRGMAEIIAAGRDGR